MMEVLDLFDISVSGLIAGLLFGILGMWLAREAKRRADLKLGLVATALMFYPYFTRGPWMDWGIGFALTGLAYYLW